MLAQIGEGEPMPPSDIKSNDSTGFGDPIAIVAQAGNQRVTLFGGGAELVIEDSSGSIVPVWDSILDLSFPEPWRNPAEKHAQCFAIQSMLYRLFVGARGAGRRVSFYSSKRQIRG